MSFHPPLIPLSISLQFHPREEAVCAPPNFHGGGGEGHLPGCEAPQARPQAQVSPAGRGSSWRQSQNRSPRFDRSPGFPTQQTLAWRLVDLGTKSGQLPRSRDSDLGINFSQWCNLSHPPFPILTASFIKTEAMSPMSVMYPAKTLFHQHILVLFFFHSSYWSSIKTGGWVLNTSSLIKILSIFSLYYNLHSSFI